MTRQYVILILLETMVCISLVLGSEIPEIERSGIELFDIDRFIDLIMSNKSFAAGLFPKLDSGFDLEDFLKRWGFDVGDKANDLLPRIVIPYSNEKDTAYEAGVYHEKEYPEFMDLLPRIQELENATDDDCSENREDRVNIVGRSDWDAEPSAAKFPTRSLPAVYVVISQAGKRCYDYNNCTERIQEEQKLYMEQYGDLLSNFYIGDDGSAYEGLGWNLYDDRLLGGLGEASLRVTFFGNLHYELPSPTAMHTFNLLLKEGICSEKISPAYKYVSIRKYYDDWKYLGDAMDEEMRRWERYVDDFVSPLTRDHGTAGLFPVVFRQEWKATKPKKKIDSLAPPVDNIVVRDWGNRCFTSAGCATAMQMDQIYAFETFGEVPHNFYIGDDGLAYEGRGWDLAPQDDFKNRKKNIVVAFFGQYNSYPPSSRAFMAFWKLLEFGVLIRKISPNYKIVSYRSMFSDTPYPGEGLHSALKTMERYSENP